MVLNRWRSWQEKVKVHKHKSRFEERELLKGSVIWSILPSLRILDVKGVAISASETKVCQEDKKGFRLRHLIVKKL